MWSARVFNESSWQDLSVVEVSGPFTSARLADAASKLGAANQFAGLRHLREEANPETARGAIETWAKRAEEEASEFDWAIGGRVLERDEGVALYTMSEGSSALPERPVTIAWHDRTAVIVPCHLDPTLVQLTYTPDLEDEQRVERMRFRYATPEHELETILEWRGYFGAQSAVIDGRSPMATDGRSFVTTVRGKVGAIAVSVLRRFKGLQTTPKRDPFLPKRRRDLTARYPHIVARYPDLASVSRHQSECATVFVHGTMSCGIVGLKDLFPNLPVREAVASRYEHDTFTAAHQNGQDLADLIRARLRVQRLLLVAHSRGGLVATYARSFLKEQGFGGEISLYAFGTPYLGTPLVEVAGKTLGLLSQLGQDFIGILPVPSPYSMALTYLVDPPDLPPGIKFMAENSGELVALRLRDAEGIRSWGSRFDANRGPSGFSPEFRGAFNEAMGNISHDLIVPTASALGFGAPQPLLNCSHVFYFREPAVQGVIASFNNPPAPTAVAAAAPPAQPAANVTGPPQLTAAAKAKAKDLKIGK